MSHLQKPKPFEGYLGGDFKVVSSYGHVRDLPKDKADDFDNNFEPTYEITSDKKDVIRELKKIIKGGRDYYLASDDREGRRSH